MAGAAPVWAGVAVEGAAPGEEFVEDQTETEDVAAVVGFEAAHLFGRHVADSAHHHAGLSSDGDGVGGLGGVRLGQLGEPEVQDLDAAVAGEEDVVGLEIAVDNAGFVRGREAGGDLRGYIGGLLGSGLDDAEGLAVDQFVDEVAFANVVEGDDVGG